MLRKAFRNIVPATLIPVLYRSSSALVLGYGIGCLVLFHYNEAVPGYAASRRYADAQIL